MSMNKILTWLALAFVASASAQTVPYSPIVQGQVWTASQWNTAWGSKTDYPAPLSSLAAISAYTIPCNSSGSSAVPTACITLPSGFQLYPRTSAEIAAGVTPSNYGYAAWNVLRYGADSTGIANSTSAFTACASIGTNPRCVIPAGTYLLSSNVTASQTVTWDMQGTVTFTGSGSLSSGLQLSTNGTELFLNGVPITLYSHVDKFTATSGQTSFTLSAAPVLANAATVVLNGAELTPTDDYSISGTTLALVNGAVAGQKLVVRY